MRLRWRPSGRTEALAWVALAAASLWLRSAFPNTALPFAGHDDALFVRQAYSLSDGHWLGPYTNLTLAKAPFFAMFMVAANWLAIPLILAEQLAYLAAAALVAWLARRWTGRRAPALALFAALAFNPTVWDVEMARVSRDGLYLSLSLGTVGLLLAALFRPAGPGGLGRAAAWGGGLGLLAAAFWMTREEGVWLLPAAGAALLAALPEVWRRRGAWWPAAVALACAAATFAAADGGVAAANAKWYGVFATSEFHAGAFLRGYGALARIRQDSFRRFVVTSQDSRARAYRVSPAARELQPFLDGPMGAAWRGLACEAQQLTECPEIPAGWFVWALRDAVAQAGHAGSGGAAMAFYARMADEIDAACARQEIPCGPPRANLGPVFRPEYLADTWHELPTVARVTLGMAGPLGGLPSEGPRRGLARFADMVGRVAEPAEQAWFVRGWAAATAGRPAVGLRSHADAAATLDLSDTPAPDMAAGKPGWRAVRFDARIACPGMACDLTATAPDGGNVALPLADAAEGKQVAAPGLTLTVEHADRAEPGLAQRRTRWQRTVARRIAAAYAALAAPLLLAGLAGWALALLRPSRRPSTAVSALLLAAMVAAATRVALLAYIDATSMPSIRVLYAAPATPFAIIAIVLGLWCGGRALWPRRAG